jgi:hypothetical protein
MPRRPEFLDPSLNPTGQNSAQLDRISAADGERKCLKNRTPRHTTHLDSRGPSGFRVRCFQPLSHLSKPLNYRIFSDWPRPPLLLPKFLPALVLASAEGFGNLEWRTQSSGRVDPLVASSVQAAFGPLSDAQYVQAVERHARDDASHEGAAAAFSGVTINFAPNQTAKCSSKPRSVLLETREVDIGIHQRGGAPDGRGARYPWDRKTIRVPGKVLANLTLAVGKIFIRGARMSDACSAL